MMTDQDRAELIVDRLLQYIRDPTDRDGSIHCRVREAWERALFQPQERQAFREGLVAHCRLAMREG